MNRWFTTIAVVLFCSAALRADVTIVQTTTVEGGMASMAASSGGSVSPKMTTRIKGMKSRSEVEAGPVNVITIVDLAAKQMTILRPDQKTATVVSMTAVTTAPMAPQTGPSVDASMKATGKSQTIDGLKCDEYSFSTNMDMSTIGGGQMPPEAAAAMQGMKMAMVGSLWVAKDAPGVGEYLAFQKAAAADDMAKATMNSAGMNIPGMDKMMKAMGAVSGLPYLTEMTITIDGTGQFADMMRQMGPMKITTKVNSITRDAISDDLFKVPEGYTIVKQ